MNETGLVPATVQLVGEQIAGESAKVKKELEKLLKSLNKSTFDVADLLHKVKKFDYYRPEFDTFAEYLKTLDIKQRKGQYLERITDVMEQVAVGVVQKARGHVLVSFECGNSRGDRHVHTFSSPTYARTG